MASQIPSNAACIFCKIIKGEIPCMKLLETETVLAFLDIGPTSKGHSLVIPKYHGAKLVDIPDEHLSDVLPTVKKLVKATGATDYNVLQNNGTIAHQEVHHVHFHMIPKPNKEEGLIIDWPAKPADMAKLKELCEDIKSRI
ncbi:HIT family protein 1 [Thelonectria olida]|uniref:Adenosine 5'-monophosphoramidase HNT1 n=1 Tax=Thelonectria olida TaxID=1576542 RepID=A0A9P8W057_9HYPO|nr:HIT family protein 1 [Thelonectria olida]